ncbi:hypothetical protein N8T08_003344 [Aspergillus melleus]|uniref:Uncharacterized protein n=1 Tax=Aspergillus melleus TaxID=138277 RepID=A0ACC3B7F7_9EURO|nr:hypothetical protein N8T08_003344 [Aspergillus melleus]
MSPPSNNLAALAAQISQATEQAARHQIMDACQTMFDALLGPAEHLRWLACRYHDMSSLRWLYHFNIAAAIPLDRVVPETYPASAKPVEATECYGSSQLANYASYSIAFDTDEPMFVHLRQFPERERRFANTMVEMTSTEGYGVHHLVDGYSWEEVEGTVVDDVKGVVEQGRAALPPAVVERVTFQTHDFFTPQPVTADVYLLRFILHDHPDARAITILQNILPAMKKGSRVILNEGVLPEPLTLAKGEERIARIMEMEMITTFNARERPLEDWKKLCQGAHPGLKLQRFYKPAGSIMSIMDSRFDQFFRLEGNQNFDRPILTTTFAVPGSWLVLGDLNSLCAESGVYKRDFAHPNRLLLFDIDGLTSVRLIPEPRQVYHFVEEDQLWPPSTQPPTAGHLRPSLAGRHRDDRENATLVSLGAVRHSNGIGAAAEECHGNFTIHPNDNTTRLFDSCTTIVGNINVGRSIDGELYLRGIYNVTGTIEFRPDHDHDRDYRPVVHFFNAPNLFHLGGLKVHEGFSVYELYLRDLETVGDISVYVDEYALNLELESLVEADSINISRALSTLDLPDLRTVHGALTIDYHAANSSSNEPASSNHGRIDFPSLESAGSVNLAGATENITLPRLTTVGPLNGSGFESGLTLHMEKLEKPFHLDLPRLRSVRDQMNLYGNVKESVALSPTSSRPID